MWVGMPSASSDGFAVRPFPKRRGTCLSYHGRARDSPTLSVRPNPASVEQPKEPVPFALPPPHQDSRRVFAYLRKRGIASQVIRGFLDFGLLYEDGEHHNCVFVGRDETGKAVFAGKRGTTWSQSPFVSVSACGKTAPTSLLLLFPSNPLRWVSMGTLFLLHPQPFPAQQCRGPVLPPWRRSGNLPQGKPALKEEHPVSGRGQAGAGGRREDHSKVSGIGVHRGGSPVSPRQGLERGPLPPAAQAREGVMPKKQDPYLDQTKII